jgi:hypothetical protein
MLSEALQRNAKHEARLSNISGNFRMQELPKHIQRSFVVFATQDDNLK